MLDGYKYKPFYQTDGTFSLTINMRRVLSSSGSNNKSEVDELQSETSRSITRGKNVKDEKRQESIQEFSRISLIKINLAISPVMQGWEFCGDYR